MRKTLSIMVVALTLAACQSDGTKGSELVVTQNGLRSDGYYESHNGNIIYLARFFNDGNVVLVGGLKDNYTEILGYLTPKGPEQNDNVHYVPYTLYENDSVFFRTRSPRGELSYRGFSESPDTLRIIKYSHINGNTTHLSYGFNPYHK